MKVILKEDVKGLGKKESLVEVSDGYARNFLIPKGLAVEATAANINIMQTKKEAEKNRKERELAQAKELAEKLKGIVVKAGENLKKMKSLGTYEAEVKLYPGVSAKLTVKIEQE